MAGSAALILLALETAPDAGTGILYILVFGLGSIAGMALLSFVIAIPLRFSARALTRLHNLLQGAVGVATVAIGLLTAVGAGRAFFE
jgi:hypothetical protein